MRRCEKPLAHLILKVHCVLLLLILTKKQHIMKLLILRKDIRSYMFPFIFSVKKMEIDDNQKLDLCRIIYLLKESGFIIIS